MSFHSHPVDRTRSRRWADEAARNKTKYEWTAEKRQYLLDNWQRMTDEQLATTLDLSADYVKTKRQNLSLLRPRGTLSHRK